MRFGYHIVGIFVWMLGGLTACGDGGGAWPDEALRLDVGDQAGLYGAAAADIARLAASTAAMHGGEAPTRFVVYDQPTLELFAIDQESRLGPFDQVVLDAIMAALGDVVFVVNPVDGLVGGGYSVPITTVPGDPGPDTTTVEGLVAPPGAALLIFGVPYSAWGGGFTGGEWPGDANSPSTSTSGSTRLRRCLGLRRPESRSGMAIGTLSATEPWEPPPQSLEVDQPPPHQVSAD